MLEKLKTNKIFDIVNKSRGYEILFTGNDKAKIYNILLEHQTEDIILVDVNTQEEYEPVLCNFSEDYILKKIKI